MWTVASWVQRPVDAEDSLRRREAESRRRSSVVSLHRKRWIRDSAGTPLAFSDQAAPQKKKHCSATCE